MKPKPLSRAGIAIAALLIIAPRIAAAADVAKDIAQLTGIDTPESRKLDKEADQLVERLQKLRAEASAASRAAATKIDRKAFMQALKRGAPPVQPQDRRASELYSPANPLAKQAYERADAAAAARAHAALAQRCLAPSAKGAPPKGGGVASPYLCDAVRAGGAPAGQDDPWELCACMRAYLTGLQKEYDSLQARVRRFVGRQHSSIGTITAEKVEQTFSRQYTQYLPPARFTERATQSFEQDARTIQREFARSRIRQRLDDRAFVNLNPSPFLLSRHGAYQIVLGAQGELWKLYDTEVNWQLGILRQKDGVRQKQLFDAFDAADQATMARHPEFQANDTADGFVAEMEPLARKNDQRDYAYIEETAQSLRNLAVTLFDTQRRLAQDAEDWKRYAAKDGETPQAEWPITTPGPVTFEIHPSRHDPVHCCLRMITKNDRPFDDPETHLWAHFPTDLLQRFPEMTLKGKDGGRPSVLLSFSPSTNGPTLLSATASGADAAQRP